MHWSLKSFSAANGPSRCRQAISAKRRWQLKAKIYNYVLNRILTKLTALHEIHTTKKRRSKDRRLVLALSIFPGRCQPSIVDRNELNYRVRNGNGWTLILISTNSMSSSFPRKQTILYCFASYLSRPFSDLSYISIEKPASAFRDGKGKAAEGISFRACAEANDPQLALTWWPVPDSNRC